MPAFNLGNLADAAEGLFSGPLISLEPSPTYKVHKFPDDIADSPYFVVFRMVNKPILRSLGSSIGGRITGALNRGQAVGGAAGAINQITGRIVSRSLNNLSIPARGYALPMPSNLATGYNAQYNDTPIGALGAMGKRIGESYAGPEGGSYYKGIANAIQNANIGMADLKGGAANMLIGAVQEGGLAGLIAAAGGGALPGAAVAGAAAVGQGVLAGAGIARNPHLASIFQGVGFRRHQFQYKLIARNAAESATLRAMIKSFKYGMAPKYRAGDHIFDYPNEFDISLNAGDYLFKIGRSVLEDFTVDYTGEGTPAFFEDTGAPYSVVLNMTFKETSIVTKREVSNGR